MEAGDKDNCKQYPPGPTRDACLAGVRFGYIPPECANREGAALWQCILNSGTPVGVVTIPTECIGLSGQALAVCLAKYGIGNGTIPPQCVNFCPVPVATKDRPITAADQAAYEECKRTEGQMLAQCIAYFTGMYGYGTGGPGGDPEGGIRQRDRLFSGTIRNNDTGVIGGNPGDQCGPRCNASTMSIAEYTLCVAQYGSGGSGGGGSGGGSGGTGTGVIDSTSRSSGASMNNAALQRACEPYQGTATYADCIANGGPRPMTGAGTGIGQTPRVGTNPSTVPSVIPGANPGANLGANPGAAVSPGRTVTPGPVSSVGTPTSPSVLPTAPTVQPGGSGSSSSGRVGGSATGALF
jgi:hypothetical protein